MGRVGNGQPITGVDLSMVARDGVRRFRDPGNHMSACRTPLTPRLRVDDLITRVRTNSIPGHASKALQELFALMRSHAS